MATYAGLQSYAHEVTLNRFFNDLYERKLRFKISNEEEDDIRDSVIEIVENIVQIIGVIEPKFRIGKKVLVGSGVEQTQIVQPVDYDFLLTLEELSSEDAYSIRPCPEKSGFVHVRIEKETLKQEWFEMVRDDELLSTQPSLYYFSNPDGFRQHFHRVIQKAIYCLREKRIVMKTGSLSPKTGSIEKHGPAFTPTFIWQRNGEEERMDVYVDLCPVIMNKNLDKFLDAQDCVCPTYYEYVQKIGSAVLMPCNKSVSCKQGLCFRVTFTQAEILLIRDMSEHHRKCYKLLKYVLNGIINRTATVFHSYALKTLVLNHHYYDHCEENSNIAQCVMSLILDIQTIVENSPGSLLRYDMRQKLPNIFFKGMSVWNHEQSILDSDIKIRLCRLLKRLETISNMKEYDFNKCYIRSVNCSNLNRVYVPIGFILYEALDHIFAKQ